MCNLTFEKSKKEKEKKRHWGVPRKSLGVGGEKKKVRIRSLLNAGKEEKKGVVGGKNGKKNLSGRGGEIIIFFSSSKKGSIKR